MTWLSSLLKSRRAESPFSSFPTQLGVLWAPWGKERPPENCVIRSNQSAPSSLWLQKGRLSGDRARAPLHPTTVRGAGVCRGPTYRLALQEGRGSPPTGCHQDVPRILIVSRRGESLTSQETPAGLLVQAGIRRRPSGAPWSLARGQSLG